MTRRVLRRIPVAALTAAALVAACSKGDKSADSAKMADSSAAATSAAAPPSAPAAPAAATLTDPNIVAILDAANAADSSAGAVAATKGTSSEVRTFGKDMMRDHHALRKMGQDLAKKLNVTPQMPTGDSSQAAATAWHDSLTSMAKGAAFDKAYIDHEVSYHQAVLQTAQTALGAAQNAELKSLIQKAAPNIQAHLEHAQKIQSKLGSGAGGGAAGGTAAGGAAAGGAGAAGTKSGSTDTAGTKKP
jgi:putative membrane protein